MTGSLLVDALRLVVITDRRLAAPRSLEAVVREALAAGARAIQLREKDAPARELAERARAMLELTRAAGALLIINDRVDVALATGADGVHLGPDDLPAIAQEASTQSLNPRRQPIEGQTNPLTWAPPTPPPPPEPEHVEGLLPTIKHPSTNRSNLSQRLDG